MYPARRRIRRQTHRTKFTVRIRCPFRYPQYPYLARANVNVGYCEERELPAMRAGCTLSPPCLPLLA